MAVSGASHESARPTSESEPTSDSEPEFAPRPIDRWIRALTMVAFVVGIVLCAVTAPIVAVVLYALGSGDSTGGPLAIIGFGALIVFGMLLASVIMMRQRKATTAGCGLGLLGGLVLTLVMAYEVVDSLPAGLEISTVLCALVPAILVVTSAAALILGALARRSGDGREAGRNPESAA